MSSSSNNNEWRVWVVQEDTGAYASCWPAKILGLYESLYDAQVRASEELATTETACQVFEMFVQRERQGGPTGGGEEELLPLDVQEFQQLQDQQRGDEGVEVHLQNPGEDWLPQDAKQRIAAFHEEQEAHRQSVRDMRDKKLQEFAEGSGQVVLVGDTLQRLDAIEAELVEAAEKLCNLDEDVDEFYARRAVLMEERSALQAVLMDLARAHGDYDVQCALQARFSFRTC